MIFTESPLAGAWVIELEPKRDERGFFVRTFDAAEMSARGLDFRVVQAGMSVNPYAGTLRGLHYQASPHEEGKLVRCGAGAIYDVIVDLREESASYREWFALELTPANQRTLFVPPGVAHGFQTLLDDTEVHYQMTYEQVPSHAHGVRWDDPAFGIDWPHPVRTISERDRAYPDVDA